MLTAKPKLVVTFRADWRGRGTWGARPAGDPYSLVAVAADLDDLRDWAVCNGYDGNLDIND